MLETRELWVALSLPPAEAPARGRLESLASRAQRFTPRVSLAPPDDLLLEVKGSLGLFGGAERLCTLLATEFAPHGCVAIALAPTPLAALTAARARVPLCLLDTACLVGQISALPLGALRWPEDILQRLARMGVRTIGQALRLPRAGFARRFGAGQLAMLDRLIGRRADPQPAFQPLERFRDSRDFGHELEYCGGIVAAIAPLLESL